MTAERLEERLTSRDLTLSRVQADATRKAVKDLRDLEKETIAIIREVEVGEATRKGDNLNRVTRAVREMRDASRRVYRSNARRTLRRHSERWEIHSRWSRLHPVRRLVRWVVAHARIRRGYRWSSLHKMHTHPRLWKSVRNDLTREIRIPF